MRPMQLLVALLLFAMSCSTPPSVPQTAQTAVASPPPAITPAPFSTLVYGSEFTVYPEYNGIVTMHNGDSYSVRAILAVQRLPVPNCKPNKHFACETGIKIVSEGFNSRFYPLPETEIDKELDRITSQWETALSAPLLYLGTP